MHLDLNLLVALDALLETGSVAAAADRLYLSQPAMSRTLGRLRRTTGDPILVRAGRAMTPTPYALAVRAEVHALVQGARAVLKPRQTLELGLLERTFTLRCHDALTAAMGPPLITAVQAEAPGVRLRFLAEASGDTLDLRRGEVDLEVGSAAPALPDARAETAGYDRLVVALRPEHPAAVGELTPKRYAAALHVTVSRRGRLEDPVDGLLAEHGLSRRVVASAPTGAAALEFVRAGDLVAAVPEASLRGPLRALELHTRPLPLAAQPVPVVMVWHARYDADPAHTWLRFRVREALQAVCQPGEVRGGAP